MGAMTEAQSSSPIANMGLMSMGGNTEVWSELLDNENLIKSQYDILARSFS